MCCFLVWLVVCLLLLIMGGIGAVSLLDLNAKNKEDSRVTREDVHAQEVYRILTLLTEISKVLEMFVSNLKTGAYIKYCLIFNFI